MKKIALILAMALSAKLYATTSVQLPTLTSYPEVAQKNISAIKKNKVLVFLNRTCPCTQQNIPYLNSLAKEFPNLEFIGVHSKKGATVEEIKEVLNLYKPNFSIIDDNNLEIANILKANRTPQVIILNDKNEILYNGGITERTNPNNATKLYLKNALTEITNHQEVTQKETRSLGCIILR